MTSHITLARSPKSLPILGVFVVLALALAGCAVLGDDAADSAATGAATRASGTGGSSSVRVVDAVFSTAITADQEATGLISFVFPAGVSEMHAVLVLSGIEPGTAISGAWYQLTVPDAPPEGFEVTRSGVVLDEGQVVQGTARVALNLDPGGRFLPAGAWLVRVYDGDVLIRTLSFYVLRDESQVSPTAAPSP